MNFIEGLAYTESHEWMRQEDGEILIGITDFAQHELTDIVFVELPDAGCEVKAGEACCVVESTKIASDVYAPISGVITAVNADLGSHPEWVNESPYEKGWLFRLKPADGASLSSFMDAEAYRKSIGL